MIRTIVGYSALAVIGVLVLKLVLWLVGAAFSLLVSLLWLAGIGFVIYLVLKVISPNTANRVRETVEGFGKRDDGGEAPSDEATSDEATSDEDTSDEATSE